MPYLPGVGCSFMLAGKLECTVVQSIKKWSFLTQAMSYWASPFPYNPDRSAVYRRCSGVQYILPSSYSVPVVYTAESEKCICSI